MSPEAPDMVFDANGLATVVVQDRASGDVLMVAHTNAEALRLTTETGYAHFWSRSRKALWKKGETSGNVLHVRETRVDCDGDALLFVVDPSGPACHTGSRTCFGDAPAATAGVLAELGRVIAQRARDEAPDSYTAKLLAKGPDAALKKIGEEATEVILAAKDESDERLAEESADLLFHLLVALHQRGLGIGDVLSVLERRRKA
jgi:phosphoribosyl-AMP cyclohydrolase / phosphoribosyl-ATP pyrophosphohydrolase